jgi:hypothetical protein
VIDAVLLAIGPRQVAEVTEVVRTDVAIMLDPAGEAAETDVPRADVTAADEDDATEAGDAHDVKVG